MKLFYYPSIVCYKIDDIRLYTQAAVDQLPKPEQEGLHELDEEGVAMIGDRPCRIITQIAPVEKIRRRVNGYPLQIKEFLV